MANSNIQNNTALIKSTARQLGFDYCGISTAEHLSEEAPRLKDWLDSGHHGEMQYMANHFEKRLDPTKLVEGAQSVVSLLYNYHPGSPLPEKDNFKVARYAYGKDYHFILKKKLKELLSIVQNSIEGANGRVFVDSAPVLERQWAARSGLGWIGKNTMLINKGSGSYFFIAEMILDIPLVSDNPVGDFCGTCHRCVDACPTDALRPYKMDASRCISYLTIELKDDIPDNYHGKFKDWIFGCDICQEVCPWNRFSRPHSEPGFIPDARLERMNKDKWSSMSKETYQVLFKDSAVKRTGYKGLVRNIKLAAQGN